MIIFLDESGDLGWSLNKPNGVGGSSRFVTIAGVVIEDTYINNLARDVYSILRKYQFEPYAEKKGWSFSNDQAIEVVSSVIQLKSAIPPFEIISVTSAKGNVLQPLRRNDLVFYNYMLSVLLSDVAKKFNDIKVVLDNRTIRMGSRNSFEDCLRTKCWGELGLSTNISCRFEESRRNPAIWLADWLANFIWRHYEKNVSDAYLQCTASPHFFEKRLFM